MISKYIPLIFSLSFRLLECIFLEIIVDENSLFSYFLRENSVIEI